MSISWEAYNQAMGRAADWRPNQPQPQPQTQQPVYNPQPTYQQPAYNPQPTYQQPTSYNQFGQPVYGQQPNYNQQAWGSSQGQTPNIVQRSTTTTPTLTTNYDYVNGTATVVGSLSVPSNYGEANTIKFHTEPINDYIAEFTLVTPHEEKPHSLEIIYRDGENGQHIHQSVLCGSIRSRNEFYGRDDQTGQVKWGRIQLVDPYQGRTIIDSIIYRRVPSGSIYPNDPSHIVLQFKNIPWNMVKGQNLFAVWSSENPQYFNEHNYTMNNLLPNGNFENPGFR